MLKRKDSKARGIKGWEDGFNFQWLPREGLYEGVTLKTKTSITEDHPSKDLAKTVPGGENNCSFLFEFYLFLFLATVNLHYWAWAFSSCSKQGLLSDGSARASHCIRFSCCGAQALLEHQLSSCDTGLVALGHVGSFWKRIKPMFPALAGRLLTCNHQESPQLLL